MVDGTALKHRKLLTGCLPFIPYVKNRIQNYTLPTKVHFAAHPLRSPSSSIIINIPSSQARWPQCARYISTIHCIHTTPFREKFRSWFLNDVECRLNVVGGTNQPMIDTQSSSFHSFNLSLLNDLWLLCSCCYSSWRTPAIVLKVSSAHRVETISINSTYHHHLFKADLLDEVSSQEERHQIAEWSDYRINTGVICKPEVVIFILI